MMDCSVSSSWRESSVVAAKPHDTLGGNLVRLRDLIVDIYIDPVTERHMNLHSSKTSDPLNLQQVMSSFQCADAAKRSMEPKPSPLRDSKRRLQASPVENKKDFGTKKISSRHLLSQLERMEWTNNSPLRTKAPLVRKFVAYPKEQDVEQAAGRALSQLLAAWSPPKASNERPVVDDVEQTLLRCRFSSGGLQKKIVPTLQPRPLPQPVPRSPPFHLRSTKGTHQERVAPEKTLMEIDAFSSDSSSMSSLSFPEVRQALPPALLRVSTSTILEEQDLIWSQIQQDRQKQEAAPRRHRPTWHPPEDEEVTRSHTRPPLSPQSRLYHNASSFQTPQSSSRRSHFGTPETGGAYSLSTGPCSDPSSPGTSTSKFMNRSPQGGTPARISLASSTCSSSPSRSSAIDDISKTLAYTGGRVHSARDPVTARCLVCQASLTLFHGSTVVYCAQCGTMAATDLVRSLIVDPAIH
jgi:hypothetical protein